MEVGSRLRVFGYVLFVVLLLVVLVSTVRLVDPEILESHPKVNLSEDLDEIANDSVLNLRGRDYTYVLYYSTFNSSTGEWQNWTYYRFKVQNTEESYSGWFANKSPPHVADTDKNPNPRWIKSSYATDGAAWLNTTLTRRRMTGWKYIPEFESSSYYEGIQNRYWICGDCDWGIVKENDSRLVLAVSTRSEVMDVAYEDDPDFFDNDSYFRLHIDKHERALTKVVVKRHYHTNKNDTQYVVYDMSNFGETEVKRPNGVPRFSIREIFYDIITGY